MKKQNKSEVQSPAQIADHLRLTYVPAYLLATAIGVLMLAFIGWGIWGSVSDKAYYSGVVFPTQGTTVAYPSEQHPATVSAISPVIDTNGMVHVEATLQPHPHLMPGMTAFITINTVSK